ncbi:MAG: VWA domain-containing protein [Treponema sp.]|jgi:hypothetical protein|nr:VWA domain-containing protein [Treponema sp.]
MIVKLFFLILFVFSFAQIDALDLTIEQEDLRIEQRVDGGFHLFIRKKPDIASVLIAETTKDFTFQEPNYVYRAPDWNPVNGDEVRIINGAPIPKSSRIWSLIDSTPEQDAQFGEAFHIYIPYILNYGYETGRHGEIYVHDGTYFNLRSFTLPYGDYAGAFQDNPFILDVAQKPLPGKPEGNYMGETLETFSNISRKNSGEMILSSGAEDIMPKIRELLEKEKGKSLDVVICLDTTGSMKDDIAAIKRMLVPLLSGMQGEFLSFRIGLVLYKDYMETYITRVIPFTGNNTVIQNELDRIATGGGKDIPEAVYEALYDGATKFAWEAQSRIIILIGDAPPHPRPVGRITREMTEQALTDRNIKVHTITLPQ